MPHHYKSNGTLDMRYSSSKAAVASGSYSSSSSNGGRAASYSSASYGNSSYGATYGGSSGSGHLNYKKDGSLDMRYSSSQQAASYMSTAPAVQTGYTGYRDTGSSYSAASTITNDPLVYKKDGSLDMRYSSSKQAVADYNTQTAPTQICSQSTGGSEIHYKKDGTPDMRFSSSKQAAQGTQRISGSEMHYKKDGTPDMRFSSSKQAAQVTHGMKEMKVSSSAYGIPKHIPLTKTGTPDMRNSTAKQWVMEQAKLNNIPSWIPRTKDGSLATSKALTQIFLKAKGHAVTYEQNQDRLREKYYEEKMKNEQYRRHIEEMREEPVYLPRYICLQNTEDIRRELYSSRVVPAASEELGSQGTNAKGILSLIPDSIPLLDYKKLEKTFEEKELGRGSFGVVLKGKWNTKAVAIKKLHLTQFTKKEKFSFVKELKILGCLGEHPNLVALHGYTLEPPCLVMEFVELGNLSYLMHYCSEQAIEVKMTDGRIKKKLVAGIVNGMQQLHVVQVVHGDLKPQNILVCKDFTAKITDFGLATLRGKTSSTVASTAMEDVDSPVAGTAGYMAPELLDSSSPPELSSDVYSFGVVLNEVIQEEEPYGDQFQNFQGRGPFAAVNYAKLGNRPKINSNATPRNLMQLIQKCWNADPAQRPSFPEISAQIVKDDMKFPSSV